MTTLYSTVDVALLLGILEHRITYAYRNGYLSKPETTVAGRTVHTLPDVRRIAEYFDVEVPKEAAVKRGTDE